MLFVTDRSIHEENLSQPLQAINKQFNLAVTFLSGYNEKVDVTNSKNKFYFAKTITDKMVLFKLLFHKVLTKSRD